MRGGGGEGGEEWGGSIFRGERLVGGDAVWGDFIIASSSLVQDNDNT